MPKQSQRSLARSKTSSESCSFRIIFLLILLAAGAIGIFLCLAFLQSIQQQSTIVSSSSVAQKQNLRVELNNRKAETDIRQDALPVKASDAAIPATTHKETVVLHTSVGDIRIVLRPDLSAESVDYIRKMALLNDCHNCKLYRAEKPGILQGIIANRAKVPLVTVKGSCPPGFEHVENDCPEWDPQCACHGPVRC
jgi:hypothetical protein